MNQSEFHDAELIGLLSNQDSLTMTFTLPNGSGRSIRFLKPRFRIVDFNEQNVVSRITTWARSDQTDEELLTWIHWIHSFVDSSSSLARDHAVAYVRKVRDGALTLVVLEPSRGAEAAVLCEEFQIF